MARFMPANRAMQHLGTVQERGGGNPSAPWPSLHVGWVEQVLSKPAAVPDELQRLLDGHMEQSPGPHCQFHRRFDQTTSILNCPKLRCQKKVVQEGAML